MDQKNWQNAEIFQLRRLIGQLVGVEKMFAHQAKFLEILQQLEAVRGNLTSLEKRLLEKKVKKFKDQELKKALNYLLKIS